MLLHGDGVVCPALDSALLYQKIQGAEAVEEDIRAVIRNNHTLYPLHRPNSCYDPAGGNIFARVHLVACQCRQL